MRLLNIVVIGALVFAAAYVYEIKFESDRRAPSASLQLHADIRESATPSRRCAPNGPSSKCPRALQGLAERHLPLRPVDADADSIRSKNLPERPPKVVRPGTPDPIGAMIDAVAPRRRQDR